MWLTAVPPCLCLLLFVCHCVTCFYFSLFLFYFESYFPSRVLMWLLCPEEMYFWNINSHTVWPHLTIYLPTMPPYFFKSPFAHPKELERLHMFSIMTWSDVPRGAIFTALFLQLDLVHHVAHLHWQHLRMKQKAHLSFRSEKMPLLSCNRKNFYLARRTQEHQKIWVCSYIGKHFLVTVTSFSCYILLDWTND